MATCEVCGNEYDKTFEIKIAGKTHIFDSLECAIHALAPTCRQAAWQTPENRTVKSP
jgi:hypothetical protein